MKELTKGNIYKNFFLFGFPLVISGILSMAFNTIDSIIVGRFLGARALAALGATSPLITFISSLFWGYNVGFSLFEAKLFAAGEYKRLKSVFYSNLFFSFVLSVLICGTLIVFHDFVFDLLKVEESLRSLAFQYFAVYVGGLFFMTAAVAGAYTVNAFGIGGYSLAMSTVSAVINLVGNILSAIVFDWGLLGIAFFSVLAGFVSLTGYFFKINKCFKELGVGREKIEIRFTHIKSAFSYALPNTMQQGLMYFASVFVSPIVNGLGVAASASYSVVTSVQGIAGNVYMNSARCLSNYTAQCIGEENYDKIDRGVFVGLLQSLLYGTPIIVACALFAEPVCGLFLKSDADALTKEYSYLFVRYYLPFSVFHLVCNGFHALFKGGKAPMHLIGGTLVASGSRIGLSYLLLHKGIKGFYTAWVLSWVLETLFNVVFYYIGLWRPDRKRRKKQPSLT